MQWSKQLVKIIKFGKLNEVSVLNKWFEVEMKTGFSIDFLKGAKLNPERRWDN